MSHVPPPADHKTYFRIEAILEAPKWALWTGLVLITLAVCLQVINQL